MIATGMVTDRYGAVSFEPSERTQGSRALDWSGPLVSSLRCFSDNRNEGRSFILIFISEHVSLAKAIHKATVQHCLLDHLGLLPFQQKTKVLTASDISDIGRRLKCGCHMLAGHVTLFPPYMSIFRNSVGAASKGSGFSMTMMSMMSIAAA